MPQLYYKSCTSVKVFFFSSCNPSLETMRGGMSFKNNHTHIHADKGSGLGPDIC